METQGIVESVRHDKKGLKLKNGEWYSSFDNETNANKGDEVKVTYTENTKGDRTYKNFDTIEVLKASQQPVGANEDKLTSVLVSYAKDLVVAAITNAPEPVDVSVIMPLAVTAIVKAYKQTKEELNKPMVEEPKVVKPEVIKPEDFGKN